MLTLSSLTVGHATLKCPLSSMRSSPSTSSFTYSETRFLVRPVLMAMRTWILVIRMPGSLLTISTIIWSLSLRMAAPSLRGVFLTSWIGCVCLRECVFVLVCGYRDRGIGRLSTLYSTLHTHTYTPHHLHPPPLGFLRACLFILNHIQFPTDHSLSRFQSVLAFYYASRNLIKHQ